MRKRYRTVSIPDKLYEMVEKAVKSGKGGYASVGEFVRESVRKRLRELGYRI